MLLVLNNYSSHEALSGCQWLFGIFPPSSWIMADQDLIDVLTVQSATA